MRNEFDGIEVVNGIDGIMGADKGDGDIDPPPTGKPKKP